MRFILIKKIVVCAVGLLILNNVSSSQNLSLSSNLEKVDEYWIEPPSSLLLDLPSNIQILDDGKVLWGEETRIILFSQDGKSVEVQEKAGRGPGELLSSTYYQVDNEKNIAILDKRQYKIAQFNTTFDHLGDVPFSGVRTKQFVVIGDGKYATFNDLVTNKSDPAVSLFNKEGKLVNEWGNIPYYALLQANRNGGGIVKDSEENIYYSYLGGYKIWKINRKANKISIFDQKPDYFDGTDKEKISNVVGNLQKLIPHSFEISRVSGLFFLKPNIIVQQIDDGNPWRDEEVQLYLEMWNTKGKKIADNVEIPHWIADTNGDLIYLLSDTYSNIIAKLEEKQSVKLFDIFKLKRNN